MDGLRGDPPREDHEGHEGREGHEDAPGLPEHLRALTSVVVDAGLKVHRALGPGLLESVYEQCLAHEFTVRGIAVQRQVALPVRYDGLWIDAGYRVDVLVCGAIVLEIKSVEALSRLHHALTYLRLSACRKGFLMNFNVVLFRDGLKRLLL